MRTNKKKRIRKKISTARTITMIFTCIIVIGTVLLKLPLSSKYGQNISWIDSFFIATSATCVTGLSPLAIHNQFNAFGQIVILFLIEIGGIGFMSIPVLFFSIRRKRINFSTRILLRDSMNLETKSGEFKLALSILKISFLIQFIGATILSSQFIPKYGIPQGIWFGIFHAISAFCNAGFDLFGNSLISFTEMPIVLLTISLLIVFGGLGFIVWIDLLQIRRKRLSLQSKLALATTIMLILIGCTFFSRTIEYQGSIINNISNIFFLAITPRTAGFFTLNYGTIKQYELMITMVLMFIGGTSGSTAGGLKTTTFSILMLKVFSVFKGKERTDIFYRSINEATISKAMTLFALSLIICTASIFILSITEVSEQSNLITITFEVISALGTVGLSAGITPTLTIVGKLVIIFLMFIGRVGSLTVIASLNNKSNEQEAKIKYPEEIIMLG
ncbi:Trk family potassium uptake protein (plasmid) [Enterococcus gilvus]|jgi:trk system potassium uptake protein|uniref:TrkH family potassium uptake protein n=1 Tax=Enterococcus gilvus TaxID=160453 RepID=UPI000DF605C2|nr:TrkH family potassium uptake protein [Enterococcus gilvus]AXG40833.1 Trk family potassium uptake protein [Enterococcus gilvus]